MKSIVVSAVLAAGLISSGAALANKDLANKSGCLACHVQSGKRTVGPTYEEVAATKQTAAALEAAINTGSKGGKVSGRYAGVALPMLPKGGNAKVSDADVKTLAAWIAAGAK